MSSYLNPRRSPKMTSSAAESHVKTASPYAPKGGKHERKANCDSLWLYAARLLAGALPRTPFISRRRAVGQDGNTPVAPRVAPCAIFAPRLRVDQRQRKKNALSAPVWPRVAIPPFSLPHHSGQGKTPENDHRQRNEGRSRIKTLSGSRLPGPVYTDRQRRSGVTISVRTKTAFPKTC